MYSINQGKNSSNLVSLTSANDYIKLDQIHTNKLNDVNNDLIEDSSEISTNNNKNTIIITETILYEDTDEKSSIANHKFNLVKDKVKIKPSNSTTNIYTTNSNNIKEASRKETEKRITNKNNSKGTTNTTNTTNCNKYLNTKASTSTSLLHIHIQDNEQKQDITKTKDNNTARFNTTKYTTNHTNIPNPNPPELFSFTKLNTCKNLSKISIEFQEEEKSEYSISNNKNNNNTSYTKRASIYSIADSHCEAIKKVRQMEKSLNTNNDFIQKQVDYIEIALKTKQVDHKKEKQEFEFKIPSSISGKNNLKINSNIIINSSNNNNFLANKPNTTRNKTGNIFTRTKINIPSNVNRLIQEIELENDNNNNKNNMNTNKSIQINTTKIKNKNNNNNNNNNYKNYTSNYINNNLNNINKSTTNNNNTTTTINFNNSNTNNKINPTYNPTTKTATNYKNNQSHQSNHNNNYINLNNSPTQQKLRIIDLYDNNKSSSYKKNKSAMNIRTQTSSFNNTEKEKLNKDEILNHLHNQMKIYYTKPFLSSKVYKKSYETIKTSTSPCADEVKSFIIRNKEFISNFSSTLYVKLLDNFCNILNILYNELDLKILNNSNSYYYKKAAKLNKYEVKLLINDLSSFMKTFEEIYFEIVRSNNTNNTSNTSNNIADLLDKKYSDFKKQINLLEFYLRNYEVDVRK